MQGPLLNNAKALDVPHVAGSFLPEFNLHPGPDLDLGRILSHQVVLYQGVRPVELNVSKGIRDRPGLTGFRIHKGRVQRGAVLDDTTRAHLNGLVHFGEAGITQFFWGRVNHTALGALDAHDPGMIPQFNQKPADMAAGRIVKDLLHAFLGMYCNEFNVLFKAHYPISLFRLFLAVKDTIRPETSSKPGSKSQFDVRHLPLVCLAHDLKGGLGASDQSGGTDWIGGYHAA